MTNSVLDINTSTYASHSLHTKDRDWAETNCYVDVWIELLNGLSLNPVHCLAFTIGIDFEGDQWTFFKPPLEDIRKLYNIEIQEMVVWRNLTDHIELQLSMGRLVLVELDSKYLPDTAGTAYRENHVKTTVAINKIDTLNQRLGYFHAQGYYELEGEDYRNIFRLDTPDSSDHLAPYIEIVKILEQYESTDHEQKLIARKLLHKHIKDMPVINPFVQFKTAFQEQFEWLRKQNIEVFHEYAFVTFRQFGACFELASNFLFWISSNDEPELIQAASSYRSISEKTKVYQFQLARAVSRNKELDFSVIESLGEKWQMARDSLVKYAKIT